MKISVITPSLNSGKYIERAIKSILEQGYENFEHIVMDGLSTDSTIEILKKYPHLKWVSEKDSGQSNAMNKGFNLSTGDIVVYLNADDYFLPSAFKTVIPYFEKGETFVVGDVYQIGLSGNKNRRRPKYKHIDILHHWEQWGYEDDILYSPFPLNPVQYFYKREVQEKFPFNEKNHFTMDLEFLMDTSSQFDFCKIDDILGVYILYEDAKSIVASNNAEEYWTFENFSYVDRFIEDWDEDKKKTFKNEQQKGYLKRTIGLCREQVRGEMAHKDEQLQIKQKLIEEKDAVIKERGKLYDILKEKDAIIKERGKLYDVVKQRDNELKKSKQIIEDLYQMVSRNNPLDIIRAIRFIKKTGKNNHE